MVVIAALMIGYGIGLNHQNGLWAFAWREGVRTMASAPAAEIAMLPANATIVYVGPTDFEGINYITRWQIWMGLPTYHPETALPGEQGTAAGGDELKPLVVRIARSPEQPVAIRPVIVRTSYQTLSWDGQELVLDFPRNWTEKYRVSLVYEWDAYRGTFRRMEPNTPFGTSPQ